MKKLPTVTIGIPTYKEEATIERLLLSVMQQEKNTFHLKAIDVHSDASSKETEQIVTRLHKKYPIIRLIANKERKGKFYRVNQMFNTCTSDVLVILDADITLGGNNFLEKLIAPLLSDKKATLVDAHNTLIRPKSFIGKVIHTNFALWDFVRWSIPGYKSASNFYGSATAFRATAVHSIHIPKEITDPHLYIYLAVTKQVGFRYCREAEVSQHTLETLKDLQRFTNRAIGKKDPLLESLFNVKIEELYYIPRRYKFLGVLKTFLAYPLYAPLAILLSFYIARTAPKKKPATSVWETSTSSRKQLDEQEKKHSIIISSYDDVNNPHYGGGGAIAVHELAKRLVNNYTVRVLSWNYSGKKQEVIDTVSYERFGLPFLNPKAAMFVYQLCLPFFAKTKHYDLWLESFCPPFTTAILPLFTQKPVVGIVHMLAAEDMERKYKLPFHLIENFGLKRYKNMIATSDFIKNKIKKTHPTGSIQVISNGIDAVYKTELERERFILFMGRIEINQKGLDLLLPALKQCQKSEKDNLKLIIAGETHKKEMINLQQIIQTYQLENSVVFAGRVSGRKKTQLLRKAACLVVPSRFETFSMVALEALAHGTPLVCFDIKGLSWLCRSIAYKVKPYDIHALAQAIQLVLKNTKRTDEKRKEGKKYAQQYTWEIIAKQYEQYIDTLNI